MEENQEENDRRESRKKETGESQVVHYMLCCNTGICAPNDLVLSHSNSRVADGLYPYYLCVKRCLVGQSGGNNQPCYVKLQRISQTMTLRSPLLHAALYLIQPACSD